MRFEKMDDLQKIGMPVVHGVKEQIELFEKFLEAAGQDVTFTQTGSGLKLTVYKTADYVSEEDRQQRIKLIQRTLVILREGVGYLVATKGSRIYFEFWVESPVVGGLPPHRWNSLGELYKPSKFNPIHAPDLGLTSLNPAALGL
jgi:hypothetical protein